MCYCVTTDADKEKIKVTDGWLAPVYLRICQLQEAQAASLESRLQRYRLQYKDYWVCSACSDNGIDDKKQTGSRTEGVSVQQVVLQDGEIYGYFLPEKEILLKTGTWKRIEKSEEDHTPGWGDIYTCTDACFERLDML